MRHRRALAPEPDEAHADEDQRSPSHEERRSQVSWSDTPDGCKGDARDRRLQESGQSIEQVGDVHREWEHLEALCFGTLPSAGGMDAEAHNLKDPMRTQRFGDVGHQGSHLVAKALGPRPEALGEVLEDADLVLDGGDEAHVVTPVDLALFEQGKDVALDPRPDVVRLELRDQDGTADIDVR